MKGGNNMPKVTLLNLKGEKLKEIKLNDEIFGIEPNEQTVYDAIVRKGASLRQGTHSVKDRSEVSGGGIKPWRQKGTGRARQGCTLRCPRCRPCPRPPRPGALQSAACRPSAPPARSG